MELLHGWLLTAFRCIRVCEILLKRQNCVAICNELCMSYNKVLGTVLYLLGYMHSSDPEALQHFSDFYLVLLYQSPTWIRKLP